MCILYIYTNSNKQCKIIFKSCSKKGDRMNKAKKIIVSIFMISLLLNLSHTAAFYQYDDNIIISHKNGEDNIDTYNFGLKC